MKIAILSNVTVDLLAGMLAKSAEVYLAAGFDTWQQEMIMPTSGLCESRPDSVAVLLHANAYADAWRAKGDGESIIDGWLEAIGSFSRRFPTTPVFVSSIDVCNLKCRYGSETRLDEYFENYLIERIEETRAKGYNVYLLPVKDVVAELGRRNFYSAKMWYYGAMPYSMKALAALNELIARYANAAKGAKKKCLALDLDNTLWGGVVGEDGADALIFADVKEGARYKDAQRLIKKMKEQGVLLAILSKNNPEDVEQAFNRPDMVLKRDDFVAEAINWEPKCENVKRMAKTLNLGLDSFVFLDDNPAEREQMKAECPEVATVDFPTDTSALPETIAKIYDDYFFALDVTSEDVQKTAMYRAEKQRKVERESAVSVESFLQRLEMTMEVHLMKEDELKRVTQLVNKTNQFNVTTQRYGEEEIQRLGASDRSDVVVVHMADKYGDQGLVAVIILRYDEKNATIDSFLMSCRVMGREAEMEIMATVKKFLQKKGIALLRAIYRKTAKNAPVAELFEKFGFELTESSDTEKRYRINVDALPNKTNVFKEVVVQL